MNTPNHLATAVYDRAIDSMQTLVHDIELGCPGRLALAHAMVNLQLVVRAGQPARFHPAGDRRAMRLMQALQVAINYYQTPEAILAAGQESCDIFVNDFLSLIRDMSIGS